MSLAYLINTYPRASHSFIRREIAALERRGLRVHRFALRSDRARLSEPADIAEDMRTEHVLEAPRLALVRSALGLVARPRALWAGLGCAVAMGRAGRGGVAGTGGVLRHLVYLIEAAYLRERCARLGITHLHAHFGTNSTAVAALVAALGGPGYSFTTHGPEEFDAPEALSLPRKIAHARFGLGISSFGRSQLCRWSDPTHWDRLHILPCGIEPDNFSPLPLPPRGTDPALVAVGRFSPQKGFDLLIEAVALARTRLPGLTLTVVGDGELRPRLEAAIAARGLERAVTLLGWQNESGVRQALAAAHALILPSFAEGLPVVLMEAMAMGRPVIATAIAGVPELVTREEGWLVPAGDPLALAEAIIDLAGTPPDRLATMGEAARRRVEERHDIDISAALLAALFAPFVAEAR